MERPYQIAEDTWVMPSLFPVPGAGNIYVNSLIIKGREPVIIDTGPIVSREEWLRNAWAIVEPKDVRWIFLTHDDGDHVGNLEQVIEACPNARIVTGWFATGRMGVDQGRELPMPRCMWINDGDSFDVGDRTLHAVRPPVFDNPTTRGIFDPKTRVYWASDAFAMFVPGPTEDAAELPEDARWQAFYDTNRLLAPWHEWLDSERFSAKVNAIRALGIETIGSAHGPALRGKLVDEALTRLSELPSLPPYHEPNQATLEAMLAQAMQGAPAGA